jgi:hypothetical protein
MVDPLSIVGVAYPIASNFVELIQKMKKVYKGIRFAKQDLMKVIERTEMVAETHAFFSQTINNVKSITELAPMFKQHGKLIERVERESNRIIGGLERITGPFWFLITGEPVTRTDKCIAQYEWFRDGQKSVSPLFQDMKVLEKSMRTIGILVNIQMSLQAYRRDRSNLMLAQM